jgi:hypothetical protein
MPAAANAPQCKLQGALMQEALLTYFGGEKNAGLVLIAVSIAGFIAAVVFFQPRYGLRSFSLTLALFALIELAIGVGLYIRTGRQVDRLVSQLGSHPTDFFAEETSRMSVVQRNFVIVQYAELAVILISAITALALKNRPVISGVMLALLLNAAILFAFDIVAERRGAHYLGAIQAQKNP